MVTDNSDVISAFQNLINERNIRGPIALGVGSINTESGNLTYRRFNIGDSLGIEFQTFIQKVINSTYNNYQNNDVRILSYDAGYKPESNEIEWVKIPDSPWLSSLLAEIPTPSNIDLYDESEKAFTKDLRFYILFAKTSSGEDVYSFSFYSKMKELTKSNKIIVKLVGDRFELLREPGFMFDERIDCILFKDFVFSFNRTNFHRIFRYYDQIRALADSSLTAINSAIPIANFEDFQLACRSHPLKMAKLVNVAGKPYLTAIRMEDVRRTIERNQLPLKVILDQGIEKLKYDPSDQWMLLNLIDDMYLNSELTRLNYEANSKRQIGS